MVDLLRPYSVSSVRGEPDFLSIAPDEMTAAHRYLVWRHGLEKKPERMKVIDAGGVDVVRLRPFEVGDFRDLELRHFIYASGSRAALEWGRREHPGAEISVVPSTDLYVLRQLSYPELARLTLQVWNAHYYSGGRPAGLQFVVPTLLYTFRKKEDLKRAVRFSGVMPGRAARDEAGRRTGDAGIRVPLAMALCMAMRHDGMKVRSKFAPGGHPGAALERGKRAVHAGHVPEGLLKRLLECFGDGAIDRFDEYARHLLEELCSCYGLEAKSLLWTEIAVLWDRGYEAMKEAGIDAALAKGWYFGDGDYPGDGAGLRS